MSVLAITTFRGCEPSRLVSCRMQPPPRIDWFWYLHHRAATGSMQEINVPHGQHRRSSGRIGPEDLEQAPRHSHVAVRRGDAQRDGLHDAELAVSHAPLAAAAAGRSRGVGGLPAERRLVRAHVLTPAQRAARRRTRIDASGGPAVAVVILRREAGVNHDGVGRERKHAAGRAHVGGHHAASVQQRGQVRAVNADGRRPCPGHGRRCSLGAHGWRGSHHLSAPTERPEHTCVNAAPRWLAV
eukprot:352476-Chlamydomonas_euryale.AAC.36